MKKLFLKPILLLCAFVVGTSAWANSNTSTVSTKFDATGNVTGKFTQTGDFTSAVWNLGVTWSSEASWQNLDATKGAQVGSGKKPATGIVLTGSNIPGTITSVVVNTSGASDVSATVAVTVGGTGFTCSGNATASLTNSAANYTFTGSGSGDIVITWANSSSKAIYIKSITTTYSTGGGSTPSISLNSYLVNATEEGGNSTINVTYSNIASVNSEVKFYESNGTTETTYDWITASINASNNLAYSISANTGAARTAYLKVHQKDTEVYSGLITISQAAKTVASPSFNLDGSTYYQGTEIILTSAGNTIYYTTDGTTPNNTSTEYTGPIPVATGKITYKAIAYDVYRNASSVVTRTYTGVAVATLPFSWDEKETSTTGVISSSVGTYDSKPHLKFDATDDNLILHFDGVPGTLSFDIKGNSFSGGTFTVQTSSDGSAYTDLASYTTLGDKETKSYKLSADVRYIKWIYTNKSSGNVALGNINLLPVPDEPTTPTVDDVAHTVTLTTTANMAGWRTFAPVKANQNYTVDGTTKVYYASATADGKVTLTEIAGGVPANTPVILHQTSGTTITLTETATSISAPGSNLLQVSTASQNLGTVYRLGYKSAYGVGFYTYTSDSAPAGIVYLETVTAAHEFLGFDFDGETTAIERMANGQKPTANSQMFDLQGRKVAQPTKGLYIVNGKKVVIK